MIGKFQPKKVSGFNHRYIKVRSKNGIKMKAAVSQGPGLLPLRYLQPEFCTEHQYGKMQQKCARVF